jgi:hypothetical protein
MRRIFFFCMKGFGIGPLHYVSSRSDFDLEFAEIFIIKKRLPDSPSRGLDKNAYIYKFFKLGDSTLHPWLLLCQIDLLKGWFIHLKLGKWMLNFEKF